MSPGYVPWNQSGTRADRVCLRDGDVELSYGDVARWAEAVAERFAALGVRRGDVVAIMLPNCAELLIGLLGAWRLGAAATPVNPVFTANEAGYQIQDSRAVLLLTSTAGADYGVPVVLAKDLPTQSARVPRGGGALPANVFRCGAGHLRAAGRAPRRRPSGHLVGAVRGVRRGPGAHGAAAAVRIAVRLRHHRGIRAHG